MKDIKQGSIKYWKKYWEKYLEDHMSPLDYQSTELQLQRANNRIIELEREVQELKERLNLIDIYGCYQ